MVWWWLNGALLISRESLILLGLDGESAGLCHKISPSLAVTLFFQKFPCRAGEMSLFVMVKKTKSLLCRGGQGWGKQLTGALY